MPLCYSLVENPDRYSRKRWPQHWSLGHKDSVVMCRTCWNDAPCVLCTLAFRSVIPLSALMRKTHEATSMIPWCSGITNVKMPASLRRIVKRMLMGYTRAVRNPPSKKSWQRPWQWRHCSVAILLPKCSQYCRLSGFRYLSGNWPRSRLYGVLLAQCYSYFINNSFKKDHILLKGLVATVWYVSIDCLSIVTTLLFIGSLKHSILCALCTMFTRQPYLTLVTLLVLLQTRLGE